MKTLPKIAPTAEQLPLISANRLGVEVIRGAAGSGKTSTAILRLRSLAFMFEERRARAGSTEPVKIKVLTFNRTLSGYVQSLVESQVRSLTNTEVTVDTFARWAISSLPPRRIVDDEIREQEIRRLAGRLPLAPDYVVKEVEYLLGRFHPDQLDEYVTAERTGRGSTPRVIGAVRRRILDEVVVPYRNFLSQHDLSDWNDLAVDMASTQWSEKLDVVIVDESQDFSANQLRAIRHHLATDYAVTFVIDALQRIYARGFTWSEVGFTSREIRYHKLESNYRNTSEIAAFVAGIVDGVEVEDDGAMPNLLGTTRSGPRPNVIRGLYSNQAAWAVDFIKHHVDLQTETVAFLKPLGGRFFSEIKRVLKGERLRFVDITRQAEWPEGSENIALSTFHSAKGLEFDHVLILGLGAVNTAHADESIDDQITVLRRLLAVAVARARKTVTIGYKPGEESDLVRFFRDGTFESVIV